MSALSLAAGIRETILRRRETQAHSQAAIEVEVDGKKAQLTKEQREAVVQILKAGSEPVAQN